MATVYMCPDKHHKLVILMDKMRSLLNYSEYGAKSAYQNNISWDLCEKLT
jgi:hypothetical protein